MGELLANQPILVLFLILASGLLLGRIQVAGLSLGTSGVLFTALLAGHWGATVHPHIGTVGLVLFVYCVGVGAGSRFFAALRRRGSALALLSLLVTVLGVAVSYAGARLLNLPGDLAVGLFAGALTSTPALAAATQALGEGAAQVSVGYGIAYPFGVIGVVLFVQILPRLLRTQSEAPKAEGERSDVAKEAIDALLVEVEHPQLEGERIADYQAIQGLECQVTRRLQGERLVPLTYEDRFERGQVLLVVGRKDQLPLVAELLGKAVQRPVIKDVERERRQLVLTEGQFAGHTLAELELLRRYGVTVSRITRLGFTFVPTGAVMLEKGDQLTVVGEPEALQRFAEAIGHRASAFDEADLLSLGVGIALGILCGLVSLQLPGMQGLALGLVGGPLIVGLVLGHFGRVGPIKGYIPRAPRLLLQELGLVLFLAQAGIRGGEALVETLQNYGMALLGLGAAVTLLPLIVGYWLARRLFKLDLLPALGGLCGGMTSTPALGALTSRTDDEAPVVAYATAYPVALIIMTFLAKTLVTLLSG